MDNQLIKLDKYSITNQDLKTAFEQYATKGAGTRDGKQYGFSTLLRKHAGQKKWEDMLPEEQFKEFKKYAMEDFEIAKKEMGNPVEYFLDRALDPLDPMSGVYKVLLKKLGATISGNKIQLTPLLKAELEKTKELTEMKTFKEFLMEEVEILKYKGLPYLSDQMRGEHLEKPDETINTDDLSKCKPNQVNWHNDYTWVKETPNYLVQTEEWVEECRDGLEAKYGDDSDETILKELPPRMEAVAKILNLKLVSYKMEGSYSVAVFKKLKTNINENKNVNVSPEFSNTWKKFAEKNPSKELTEKDCDIISNDTLSKVGFTLRCIRENWCELYKEWCEEIGKTFIRDEQKDKERLMKLHKYTR